MAKRRTSILKERIIRLSGQVEILDCVRSGYKFRNRGEDVRFARLVEETASRLREVEFILGDDGTQ